MSTIHDVAELAHVSIATVSRVVNQHPSVSEDTRLAVKQAIEQLNYQPNANAKALAIQNTDTIGVVVTDVTDSFFAILVKAVDKVAEAHHKTTYLATEMLIRYGHKHIAYIGSNHAIFDEIERREGYLTALKDHNYPIIEHAITHNSPDFEGGEKAMIDLLSYNKDLTAVVAYNDSMAAGAISVLNENNISVPSQFSIIGFDDMPIARYLIPKLTTIRYPIDLMATYAANLALSLVDNEVRTPSTIQFNPTLVRRFSVESI